MAKPGRKPTVSDEEILRVFADADVPVLTTVEVRDAIGFSTTDGTLKRLEKLVDAGLVDQKKPGHDRMWWPTGLGESTLEIPVEA